MMIAVCKTNEAEKDVVFWFFLEHSQFDFSSPLSWKWRQE